MSAVGTTGKTGERCPEGGVWSVVGTPTTTAPIAKGDVLEPDPVSQTHRVW